MLDLDRFTSGLVQRAKAEHAATVAHDDRWVEELERRRRDIAMAGERILQRARSGAGF
jgi:hypothetical protein